MSPSRPLCYPHHRAHQHASHQQLLRVASAAPTGTGRTTRLDAFVVPAARRAHHLRHVVELAVRCQSWLVVLASHECSVHEVAALVADTPGSRAIIVRIPPVLRNSSLDLATSAPEFRELSGGRQSDLSLKRNVGLLLARLRGWRKIMFVDDDVLPLPTERIARLAHHLERHRYAGLRTIAMPDNSVVCHANRVVGSRQGIFISGAALGVNTGDLPLDVFPDIYNEDWFAFSHDACSGQVGLAGNARQLEFNPFQDPERAAREEFGDVLAEGLFARFSDGLRLESATQTYWDEFIDNRFELITGIRRRLGRIDTNEAIQAHFALECSLDQLKRIRAEDCLRFLGAWQQDKARFGKFSAGLPSHLSFADAFEYLGLSDWRQAEFGNPRLLTTHLPGVGWGDDQLAGGRRNTRRSSSRTPAGVCRF